MKAHLQDLLRTALQAVIAGSDVSAPTSIQIDAAKDKSHGDFATNLALILAKPLGKPPRAVAEMLVKNLPASAHVAKVEIAGPGFINFYLAQAAFQNVVADIFAQGAAFGRDASGAKGKIMVEFVSANPTGPMHVGHGRGAAYGDSVSNLLAATGWTVHREYYINDAGRQTDILALSVWLRYLELCGETLPFPRRAYPADYVKVTAQKLKAQYGEKFHQPAAVLFADLPAEPVAGDGAADPEKDAIKLIESSVAGADDRPVVPIEKYVLRGPKSGYWYRAIRHGDELTRDPKRFAFCAFPNVYGQSGRWTFIIDEKNTLFKADLGTARGVEVFPDAEGLRNHWLMMD